LATWRCWASWIRVDQARSDGEAFIAELGVIVLLLQIGLETRLADLIKVGPRALAVASSALSCPSCSAPIVMGPWLLPGLSGNTYLFLGATLAATSVGITGRVFRDLGKLDTPAARIVLGAAVIDDVLGLVILAVVSSLVQAGSVSVGQVGGIIAEAVIFLAGSIWIGRLIAPHSSRWLAQLDAGPSMLFAQVLATGLFLAWLAHAIGLAPIIGAFAAGLLFEPIFLRDFDRPAIVREIEPLLPAGDPGLADRLRPILLETRRPPARTHDRADRLFLRPGVFRPDRHAGGFEDPGRPGDSGHRTGV
jgi:Kef-type K+ transport system membrane component KefB